MQVHRRIPNQRMPVESLIEQYLFWIEYAELLVTRLESQTDAAGTWKQENTRMAFRGEDEKGPQ